MARSCAVRLVLGSETHAESPARRCVAPRGLWRKGGRDGVAGSGAGSRDAADPVDPIDTSSPSAADVADFVRALPGAAAREYEHSGSASRAVDPGAVDDFKHFCKTTGATLIEQREEPDGVLVFLLEKPA